MNKRKISWLLAALALPALVFGAMASTAFAEPGLDPKRASELIAIALLDDSVLEGGGWTTVRDEFSDSPVPDGAACKDSVGKLQALEKSLASNRVARGKVNMTKDDQPGEAPMEVEVEMTVYKTAASLEAAFKDLRAIYASGNIEKCFTGLLDSALGGVTGGKVTPYIPSKSDDPAAGVAAELKSSVIVSPYRLEHYAFYTGNTLTQVTISGPKAFVSKANVEFLVGLQVMSVDLVSGY